MAARKKTAKPVRVRKVSKPADGSGKRNEIAGVCWIALGLFLFVCAISPSRSHWIGKVGVFFQNLQFGLFGIAAYVIPVLFVAFGVICIAERHQKIHTGKVVAAAFGVLFLLCLINMFYLKRTDAPKFGEFVKNAYLLGQTVHTGGGAVASIPVYPVRMLIGNVGAYILFIAGIVIALILVTNLSLKKTGEDVGNVVKEQVEYRREARKQVSMYNETLNGKQDQRSDPALLGPADFRRRGAQKKRVRKSRFPVGTIEKPVEDTVIPEITMMPEPEIREETPEVKKEPAAPVKERRTRVTHDPITFSGEGDEGGLPEDELEQARLKAAAEAEKKPYTKPPLNLLSPAKRTGKRTVSSEQEILEKGKQLEGILESFGVQARVVNISQGPTVTRYELQPATGVKLSRIVSLTDDIALGMASMGIRMEAPIPGKAAVGIEIPNEETAIVTLREIIESEKFQKATSNLAFALGRDISGNIVVGDIARMPHLLVSGATGMGKSVCIHSIILSILYKSTPDQVKLILIDPKKVEFSLYNGIPHLLIPVVTDPKKATGALNWAVVEMERRYKLFSENQVNNLFRYNEKFKKDNKVEKLPQIVIVIDELADLMMVASKEVENSIMRLAQLARAAGIYMVIATQRPSVDVITGTIKANIPSRIALKTSSRVDSTTIIDTGGAERLLGNGDMLYAPTGILKPLRVQGAYVKDEDREAVVAYVKQQGIEAEYDVNVITALDNAGAAGNENGASDRGEGSDEDPLLSEAIDIAVQSGQASISLLQRKLRVGYARAGHLIDTMEQMGVVGPSEGSKPRKVIMTKEEWRRKAGEKWGMPSDGDD